MAPWVPVLVTAVLGVLSLIIQGVLVAYFLGKLKANQDAALVLANTQTAAQKALAEATAAGQAALVAVFQDFTMKAIDGMLTRLGGFDKFAAESQADRSTLSTRMGQVERNTEGLAGLREALAGFRATLETQQKHTDAELAKLGRGMDSVQRQLGTIANRNLSPPVALDRAIEGRDG